LRKTDAVATMCPSPSGYSISVILDLKKVQHPCFKEKPNGTLKTGIL